MRPLSHLTVLDLSRLFPGGFCSLQLVDLGARVIKIEEPGVGDFYRASQKTAPLGEGHFLALNRGKESLSLNLKSKRGRKILLQLVKSADVVIESFRPGRLKKLGLDYAVLKRHNAGIILCSISGYGQTGPYSQQAGHDLNYMSWAGLLSQSREHPGLQWADLAGGGLYGVVAILAALQERERSGVGTWIDLSMTEGSMALAGVQLTGQAWEGWKPEPGQGLLNGGAASYQLYPSKDGSMIALGALEPKFWQRFKQVVALKSSASSGFDPAMFSQALKNRLRRIFKSRTRQQWIKLARSYDLCLSPVQTFRDVVRDVHVKARGILATTSGPRGRKIPLVRLPFRWGQQGRQRPQTSKVAPRLGQQNHRILAKLGYNKMQIRQLKQDGVL